MNGFLKNSADIATLSRVFISESFSGLGCWMTTVLASKSYPDRSFLEATLTLLSPVDSLTIERTMPTGSLLRKILTPSDCFNSSH